MRREAWRLVAGAVALATPASAAQPYEGYWASTVAACRDQDSADRMSVEGNVFQWYETRCTARGIKSAGPNAWTMQMSCSGEGETFRASPRVTLPSPDRMVMTGSPVGRERRQTYLRCIK